MVSVMVVMTKWMVSVMVMVMEWMLMGTVESSKVVSGSKSIIYRTKTPTHRGSHYSLGDFIKTRFSRWPSRSTSLQCHGMK